VPASTINSAKSEVIEDAMLRFILTSMQTIHGKSDWLALR